MSTLKLRGELIKKFETKTFDSGFSKMEFVIQTEDKYPQFVKMQVVKDNIKMIEEMPIGTTMDFFFNVNGREWVKDDKTHYFVSLDVWRTENLEVEIKTSETHTQAEDSLPF